MAPADLDAPAEPTPAEVEFWHKYNAHFEFPTSVVVSVLAFVLMFAVVVGVLLLALSGGPDKAPVPIRMVQGSDEEGEGRLGGGGVEDPLAIGNHAIQPTEQQNLPNRTDIPQVQPQQPTTPLADPTQSGSAADSSVTPFDKLVDSLRNGIAGARKGSGSGAGSGNAPDQGDGPGGTGNDNTHKRSLRWSLRFRSADGQDYINQLAAMQAVLVIPQPPDERDAFVYRDLKNPKHGVRLAEGEWTQLAGQIQFVDTKADSVRGVASALGLNFVPRRFLAFFPRELEGELARKETGYRNRQPDQIEETVFRVTVRGGQAEVVVEEQKAKR
jgi:hypothetical protein